VVGAALGREQSAIMLMVETAGLIIFCLNLLGLRTFARMKAAGRELSPALELLLKSDLVCVGLAVFYWIPVSELLALDKLDLVCLRWVIGAALR
jgi:hypothetical protein